MSAAAKSAGQRAAVAASQLLRADLAAYTAASNLDFNNKIKARQGEGEHIYHLGFGQSPFPVPDSLRQALQRHAHVHEYLPSQGIRPLREKLLAYQRAHFAHAHFDIDSVVFGCGSKELIYLCAAVFRGPVLLQSPAWTTYAPQLRLAGRHGIVVPTDLSTQYKVTPDAIERALSANGLSDADYKLFILNSPNNPTGQIYSEAELRDLVQVFRRHKVLVVSDEIYARLTYDDKECPSIAGLYPEGTIVTTGFSKWASLGGWRCGYALFPRELRSLYAAVASAVPYVCTILGSHTYTCAPAPMQYALSDALDDRAPLEAYASRCALVLHNVAQRCASRLRAADVRVLDAQAGYYLMPDFVSLRHRFASGEQMCDAILQDVAVALMPCDPHFARPTGELSVRLCYVNFDGTELVGADAAELPGLIETHCRDTFIAVDRLADWVRTESAKPAAV